MKVAMVLLLAVSAWGQTPTCPDGYVVNHIGDDPKTGWSCDRPVVLTHPTYVTPAPQWSAQSSKDAPLVWSQSKPLANPKLEPEDAHPLVVYGDNFDEIAKCDVDGKGGWKHCIVSDGHTLDEMITVILTQMMRNEKHHVEEMATIRRGLDRLQKEIQAAKKKAAPLPKE